MIAVGVNEVAWVVVHLLQGESLGASVVSEMSDCNKVLCKTKA